MSKIGSWSVTPGQNNSTPPDGFPENQAPSTLNDGCREMMAAIRTLANDPQYIDQGSSVSYVSATSFRLGAADTTHFVVGTRLKLYDATTLYGSIWSVSSTEVMVRLDGSQTVLTTSLSSVAVSILTETNRAVPDTLYRHRNALMNPIMELWQRTSVAACANNTKTFVADRWGIDLSTGAAVNCLRSERSANASNVPSLALSGILFNNALMISVSAVDATIAAGEFAIIEQVIEGGNWRPLAQKPINLGFYVNTNKSGVYAVAVRSGNKSLSYVTNFTISAVNAWTKFSIALTESSASGTWDYSSGAGLRVAFVLAAGSTYQGGAGNWTATNILATSSQVNFLSSAGNTFAITGIQLEEGTNFTPLEWIPYEVELARCKRYYQLVPDGSVANVWLPGQAIGASSAYGITALAPVMRTSPTGTPPSASLVAVIDSTGATLLTCSAVTVLSTWPQGFLLQVLTNSATGLAAGAFALIKFLSAGTNSVVQLNAELT